MNREKIDPKNMFKLIFDFPNQIEKAVVIGKNIGLRKNYSKVNKIVLAGMGGSAVGGDLLSLALRKHMTIPFFVSRNYTLPNWVDENSLVICSSYSGNTEETLSAFNEAESKNAAIIGITTGGILSSRLEENDCDEITIPSGLQPRAAVGFSMIPMMFLITKILKIDIDLESILKEITRELLDKRDMYSKMDSQNPVYTLAQKIYKKCVIIYGETGATDKLAIRWKGQLSENSKMLAFINEIPEMNHNEIVGWVNNPELFIHLVVLWLVDINGHIRNKKRVKITQSILEKLTVKQYTVFLEGKSFIDRIFHFIHYGDWLSYWCAILHQKDPTPVDNINFLKKALGTLNEGDLD